MLQKVDIRLPQTQAGWLISLISVLTVATVALLLLFPHGMVRSSVDVSILPRLNASLNGASAILLALGYLCIRQRQIHWHRLCMLSAFGLSALFLISYVIYHAVAGPTGFAGQGWIRGLYLAILFSHILLAILVLPLALTVLHRAGQGAFSQHRRLARWTLPLWLYVSISGALIYWMLYLVPLP